MPRVVPLLASALLAACAAPPPSAGTPEAPPAATSAADFPRAGPPAAPDAAAAPPAEPPPAADPAIAAEPLPAAPELGFDFERWSIDHEVKADLAVDRCEAARLGAPPDTTIWCARHEDRPDAVLYLQALYVARAKRLVRLIELPVAVGPVAQGEPSREADRYWVKLEPRAGSDARTATFVEAPGLGCQRARDAVAEAFEEDPKAGRPRRKLIDSVCATLGRWRWVAGTLRR
jgi:hypothetical protein